MNDPGVSFGKDRRLGINFGWCLARNSIITWNIEAIREDVKWLDILLVLQRKPVGIKFHLNDFDYESVISQESKAGTPYCTAVSN